MTETYTLKSKVFLNDKERISLLKDFTREYKILKPQWHEGEALSENGWYYPILSQEDVTLQDLNVVKENGLTLLITKTQAEKLESLFRLHRTGQGIGDYPIEIVPNILK